MQTTELLRPLADALDTLSLRLSDNQSQLESLRSQGLTDAKPSWYRGRYLVMVSPGIKGGRRRRQYIGTSPEKQEQALAPHRRKLEHDRIRTLNQLLETLSQSAQAQVLLLGAAIVSEISAIERSTTNALP